MPMIANASAREKSLKKERGRRINDPDDLPDLGMKRAELLKHLQELLREKSTD